MKFSIIVPVYNAESYLEKSLLSVLEQPFKDYEIIIIDDGSTDLSNRIYQAYSQKYPDVIRSIKQGNQGQLAARCKGIGIARGEYCLFLDADDQLVSGALENIGKHIEEYNNPDMIVFPFFYQNEKSLTLSRLISCNQNLYERESKKLLYEEFVEGTLLNSVCTKAVKREIALTSCDRHELFEELRCSEDRYQSMIMLDASKNILYVPEPYYIYRIAEGSTTRNYEYSAISKFNVSVMYNEEKKYLQKWGFSTEEWNLRNDATWIKYPIYILDMFYNKTKWRETQDILRYPWREFLPKEIDLNKIDDNVYVSKWVCSLWHLIETQDYQRIKIQFLKKNLYKRLRNIKRKIFNKRK